MTVQSTENLNVGDFIAVTSTDYTPVYLVPDTQNCIYQEPITPIKFIPLEVLSISAPFILCSVAHLPDIGDGSAVQTLDSRHVSWTKLSDHFIENYCCFKQSEVKNPIVIEREPSGLDGVCCPMCSEQSLQKLKGDFKSLIVCNNCNALLTKIED